MGCVKSISTIDFVAGQTKGTEMAEGTNTNAVSRRSTRLFVEEQEVMEAGNAGQMAYESRYGSSSDEKDKERQPEKQPQMSLCRVSRTSSTSSTEGVMIPMVDLGKDLCGIFPTTREDMGKHVIRSLQAAKASAKKVEGRPINFGIVIANTLYRSSYPQVEDFQYLGTLGLKTILTLVKKDIPPEFSAFMKARGIRHIILNMQGTKKVEIPDALMRSIMEVVLDKENHPLLMHCNHGKHRTGCAIAVLRHVSRWNVDTILEEYRGYADPKVRECDLKYITEYQVSKLQGLFQAKGTRGAVLTGSRMARILFMTAIVLSIWFTTALFWERY